MLIRVVCLGTLWHPVVPRHELPSHRVMQQLCPKPLFCASLAVTTPYGTHAATTPADGPQFWWLACTVTLCALPVTLWEFRKHGYSPHYQGELYCNSPKGCHELLF